LDNFTDNDAIKLVLRLSDQWPSRISNYGWALNSVRPEMVDFGSGQGLSNFETGGIAGYSEDSAGASLRAQKSENAALGRKMPFMDGH
jgi:hypothetical protein